MSILKNLGNAVAIALAALAVIIIALAIITMGALFYRRPISVQVQWQTGDPAKWHIINELVAALSEDKEESVKTEISLDRQLRISLSVKPNENINR